MEKLPNNLLKCKLSFDFDGTIEHKPIKEYARSLIEKGHEVWIVTSRFGDDEKYKRFFATTINVDLTNNDLWDLAAEIGIPKEHIHFTNMADKSEFLKNKGFLWHIDDDWIENKQILNICKPTKSISSFGNPNWERKCNRLIKLAQTTEIEKELRAKFAKDRD